MEGRSPGLCAPSVQRGTRTLLRDVTEGPMHAESQVVVPLERLASRPHRRIFRRLEQNPRGGLNRAAMSYELARLCKVDPGAR
jgi:hypothetical protein